MPLCRELHILMKRICELSQKAESAVQSILCDELLVNICSRTYFLGLFWWLHKAPFELPLFAYVLHLGKKQFHIDSG